MEQYIIYALVGNFLSGYDLIFWKLQDKETTQEQLVPIPSIALLKHLKNQGKQVKLKLLVPHSLFIGKVENQHLQDLAHLKEEYKYDVDNIFSLEYRKNLLKATIERGNSSTITKEFERFLSLLERLGFSSQIQNYKERWEKIEKQIKGKDKIEEEINKDLEKLLNDIIKSQKIKDTFEKLNEEWQKYKNNIEIEIIPSAGTYKNIEYSGWHYDSRVLYNYTIYVLDLLNTIDIFKNNKNDLKIEVYLDVSVGLNALVSETLIAYMSALMFWQYLFLGEKNISGEFYILSAEPVIGTPQKDVYKFHKEKLSYKVAFEKPLNWQQSQEILKSLKGVFSTQLLNELKEYINQIVLLFNSIKFNIPLAIPTFAPWKNFNDVFSFAKKIFVEFQNSCSISYKEKLSKVEPAKNLNLEFFDIRNLSYLLALGANISKNLNVYLSNINQPTGILCLSDKNLDKFKKLYNHYNLISNIAFLERDWMALCSKNLSLNQQWRSLCKAMNKRKKRSCNNIQKNFERNFLAHSGFEYNVTLIRKAPYSNDCKVKNLINCKDLREIKYEDKYKDSIKKLILEL